MALADSECYGLEIPNARLSCFSTKALVNVGSNMVKLVPGRVSTEVDAHLAYDTQGIIRKVHDLLKLYNDNNVPHERLLFKIPSTWQGIEAARLLESEGIHTHLTFVYRFAQAAAAAQAGASVIQIFVGRVRDWARTHSDDEEIEAAKLRGEDPGLALATKAYNYIHKYGHKSKLMAAAVRNKQDLFSLLGVDYIIAPLKVLQSLKDSVASPEEKYSFVRRLSPQSASRYTFSDEELTKWDQMSLANAMGPAAVQLPHSQSQHHHQSSRNGSASSFFTIIIPSTLHTTTDPSFNYPARNTTSLSVTRATSNYLQISSHTIITVRFISITVVQRYYPSPSKPKTN